LTKPSGFSLIELMIAIVIVSLVIVLGVPSYSVWIQNTQIRNAAESIQNGLQLARGEAVKRNTNVAFVLGTNSSWVVSVVSSGEVIEARPSSEGSKNVTRTVSPGGATTVTFNSFGGVGANADASAPFTQIVLDSSLLAPADSRDLRITIGIGGNIRMCDPNLATGTSPRAC
jgi:type IV fimbrial biogenesis protein FimT